MLNREADGPDVHSHLVGPFHAACNVDDQPIAVATYLPELFKHDGCIGRTSAPSSDERSVTLQDRRRQVRLGVVGTDVRWLLDLWLVCLQVDWWRLRRGRRWRRLGVGRRCRWHAKAQIGHAHAHIHHLRDGLLAQSRAERRRAKRHAHRQELRPLCIEKTVRK